MPALEKPHHERFAQAVALGMSAAQAYRQHVAKDKNADPVSVDPAACRLVNDSKVAARIEELRGKVAEKAESKFALTRDKWLEKLGQIARDAHDSGDFSAATGALAHIGKASAYYAAEKVEATGQLQIVIRKE